VDNQKHQTIRILPKQLITFADNSADSIANLFISLKFTPNVISFIALILGLAAGILFAAAQPLWAGAVIILCGFFDLLDGQVAAKTDKKSLFGAIFDSTLDRYSEFFIYLGIAYYYLFGHRLLFSASLGPLVVFFRFFRILDGQLYSSQSRRFGHRMPNRHHAESRKAGSSCPGFIVRFSFGCICARDDSCIDSNWSDFQFYRISENIPCEKSGKLEK